nr:MAG TPA: hypothetical protein [Bacteriophage sp.]
MGKFYLRYIIYRFSEISITFYKNRLTFPDVCAIIYIDGSVSLNIL